MKTLKERDKWQRSVLADVELSSGAKLTLMLISLCHNFKTGQCNPSYQTLATGTGMKLAAIPKHLKMGEDRDYIRRRSTKGRHSNSYDLLIPGSPATSHADSGLTAHARRGSTTDLGIGIENANPIPPSAPTTYAAAIEPPTSIRTNRKENKERNREEGDSLVPMAMPSAKKRKRDETCTGALDADFRAFFAQYPKRDDEDDARRAYRSARRAGRATAEALLAGAMRYSAEKDGTEPRFVKTAGNWIRAGSWKNAAQPPRPVATIHSNDPFEQPATAGFFRSN
jgi:hypothetical protein